MLRHARRYLVTASFTAVVAVVPIFATTADATASRRREPQLSPHGTSFVNPGVDLGESRGARALPYRSPRRVPHSDDHLVLAHYHAFYTISKDNKQPDQDFYTQNYLTNTGELLRHVSYGGLARDRPLPRAPLGGDWALKDMRTEVERAVAAGIDGFTVDLLGQSGSGYDQRVRLLMDAAQEVDPRFTITLMPDLWPALGQPTAVQTAAYLADLGSLPAAQRTDDGRLVVAPFGADREPASYWTTVLDTMRTVYGEDVFFVPVMLDYWRYVDDFAPISDGLSAWGYHNVGADRSHDVAGMADDAHRRGKLWMQPAAYGDFRPYKGTYNETQNTGLLRHTFGTAIKKDADWVQVVTWNDYVENTFVSPSPSIGWSVLDLVSYYADAFRAGRYPRIRRDVVYLSYRRQFHDATATLQAQAPSPRPGTKPRDKVEALVFLRRPAVVTITVGEASRSFRVKSGRHVVSMPLAYGLPRAEVVRDGTTVTSVSGIFPVVESPQVQTLNYYMVSSGRTGS